MDERGRISWQAQDQIQREHTTDWFWVVGIIAIAIAVLSIYFDNLLFALLILVGSFAVFIQSQAGPQIIPFEINRQGVVINGTLYPYSTLESFWVMDEDGIERDRILIKSQKLFVPLIIMPFEDEVSPEEVRNYLLEYLDEVQMEEPAMQVLMQILGF